MAVIVLGLGVRWAWAASRDQVVPIRAPGPSVSQGVDPSARGSPAVLPTVTTSASPSSGGAPAGVVVVDVVGQVARPGLVTLPAGARVAEAIAAAGGATSQADVALVNQARLVIDGEQIRIPRPGEVVAAAPGTTGGGVGASGSSGLVSLNSADVAAFDSLPGVGPVLAQRILQWRTAHGRFSSVDELGEVSGIGDKLMTQLRPLVTL